MSNSKTGRIKSMTYDCGSTYRSDFQKYDFEAPTPTTYKEKVPPVTPSYPLLRNLHTLSDVKIKIPFDLLLKRKEIIRTNPAVAQKPYDRQIDESRKEVQKTRPRLVVTPAVSMDDIADDRARSILCEDMYCSSTEKALKEAISPYFSVKAPIPDLPTLSNPIFLPQYNPPVVSPEWRMETVTWDNKQLRCYCDQTALFWMSRQPIKCRACVESKIVADHRRLKARR